MAAFVVMGGGNQHRCGGWSAAGLMKEGMV